MYRLCIAIDKNGNKVVKFSPRVGGRGFSVQTNGNLPYTQLNGIGEKTRGELLEHICRYGTKRKIKLALMHLQEV
jgi:hypothetical protein